MSDDTQLTGCPPALLQYYKFDGERKVYKCRMCADKNARIGKIAEHSSRSNFHRHIREYHPDVIHSDKQRNERFGELVATAVAVNNIPFNVIESKEMRAVFKFLDSKIKLPSRRAISTKSIPQILQRKLYNIVAAAKGFPVCITTDGWSSSTGGTYLVSITIHYIDADWTYHEAILATKPLHGSHDAASTAAVIKEEISKAELEVHCAVTDGARVMPAMCKILGYENVWCVVHVLQLSVRNLDAEPAVKALFDKMNALAGNLRRSSPNRAKLLSYLQKNGIDEPKGIPRSCVTRWNSDVHQLKRVLEYVDTVNEMIRDGVKLGITEFTPDEKKLNKTLQVILQYPFAATAEMCASTSCISDALVIMLCLRKRVAYMAEEDSSSTVKRFCSIFRKDLETRMENTVLHDWKFKCAILVDPRYFLLDDLFSKNKKENSEWWTSVESVFVEKYEDEDDDSDVASVISTMSLDNRSATDAPGPSKMDRSTFSGSLMDDILPSSTPSHSSLPKKNKILQEELSNYKKMIIQNARVSGAKGHLEFWKKHSSTFPSLSTIARKLLCIPASSVLSERTFSRATSLYRNKNRTSLEDEKAEMCILVGANREDDIRPRNVQKVSIKPIKSMGEFSTDEESELATQSPDEYDSEEELVMMKQSVTRARQAAKERQAEMEADRTENVTTSRSKRGGGTSKKSTTSAKRVKK